jgi:hypothetical protein
MHYVLGLFALALALLWGHRWASTPPKLLALAAIAALSVYGVTVVSAYATSVVYSHRAEGFDTDRDGVISLQEQSPSQSEAMERAVNDSGRNLTVFFAAPWALASTTVAFGLLAAFRALGRQRWASS